MGQVVTGHDQQPVLMQGPRQLGREVFGVGREVAVDDGAQAAVAARRGLSTRPKA
ncbi:hypothetical protein SAV14893_082130 [Streptomyces avermitilis]|uniref:Uncharacterized protein n=1 Tax=Streptomyces avermitilis TaxID=33903 RepID=A0A4D4MA84_STRAX|nr:hypothetical protein SAV14893_082130 [Streptomyces avermitilis]GDY70795.1 hypothetical protein SAV31267_002800 [Streptomyces avermitilis]